MKCIHCIILGQVQGVWFRQSTKEQADNLKIKGWVKNLPNGSVELVACGQLPEIETFQSWLKHGPEAAIVENVLSEVVEEFDFSSFDVVYD